MSQTDKSISEIVWTAPQKRIDASAMTRLMRELSEHHDAPGKDDRTFHRWTVENLEQFWSTLWQDCGFIGDPGPTVVTDPDRMPGARWFPLAHINYAENLLRRRNADDTAILFRREDGFTSALTFAELCAQVSQCARALADAGAGPGDRVCAYMPNCPEAAVAMLAAVSLGAVFSSASPDFGVRGVLDRFGQIEPKVLIAANGYVYNGRVHDRMTMVQDIAAGLPTVQKVLLVPFADMQTDVTTVSHAVLWPEVLSDYMPSDLSFTRVPFDHPLFIMFSSGTTGAPKCIVHGHGGTLLQHIKEHRYHLDIRTGDRVFYFTTCGWMMWNWLMSALASGAILCLYDGAPAYPSMTTLFDYVTEEDISFFGTSAKFIDALKTAGVSPGRTHDLSSLRTIGSTGSPLSPDSFDYVYAHIKDDVHLASIAGGTDIIACFVGGNPRRPVRRGEIQGPALAMDVAIFDSNGKRVVGEAGELVCANAFPSMPIGFWNDPDGSRYHAAYFETFPNVWTHGDWVEETEHGGFIIYGRSDATLNPGGVRIGTAEIYRVVEGMDGITEALVVGQDWQDDVRIVLFVTLNTNRELEDSLIKEIKTRIRQDCSPRHVPEKILAVTDIPRTRSGKISELAVRDVLHGRPVKNTEALANPEALDQYKDRSELRE